MPALGPDDLVQLLLDVLQGRAQVVPLELLSPLAEPIEHVLDARHRRLRILEPRWNMRRSAFQRSPSDMRSSDIAASRSSASRSASC